MSGRGIRERHLNEVYHVMSNRNFNGEISTGPDMMHPLAEAVKTGIPGIANAAVVSFGEQTLFTAGDKRIKRATITSSPGLFDIFTFTVLHGEANTLNDPSSVVLTRATALALFGREAVVNETIQLNNSRSAVVKAVVADMPRNGTLQFDAILPFNTSSPKVQEAAREWVNCSNRVFIQTHAE